MRLEVAVIAAAPGGPAPARNAALAACTADVLVLRDDDTEPDAGWLAALQAAWDAADERVAVISGPLRARVSGDRPGWLDDAALGAWGLHEADARTFHAGNLSLRADAARGAGGFWPARGWPGHRDWHTEEHHLQRDLLAQGWAAAFAADAVAYRLVRPAGRRDLARRRARTGAREQAVGVARGRPVLLRTLASSAAGMALAAEPRRTARLARAADALGALASTRVAGPSLAPVARETPFRASVPIGPPARTGPPAPSLPRGVTLCTPWGRMRRHTSAENGGGRRSGPTVLLYHRLADRADGDDPLALCVAPQRFAEHLDVLRATREIVPLDAVARGEAGPHTVALTFDDGYADCLALADLDVPVTLFVATSHVEEGRAFWWDALGRAAHEQPGHVLRHGDRAWRLGPAAAPHLNAYVQPLAPAAIDEVLEAAGAAGPPPEADRPMTVDELRTLAEAPRVTLGAHTRTHRSLRHATPTEQRADIARSRDDLARWTGVAPDAFSYPFGVPGEAFDDTTVAVVRDLGFTCAVQNSAQPTGDRFRIPRHTVADVDGPTFARWLADR